MGLIRRAQNVIWDVVDGVTVLCDTKCGEYFELNGSGALVWSMCDGSTPADIVEGLLRAYPAQSRDQVTEDVGGLLSALATVRLVTIEAAQPCVVSEQ